MTATQPGTALPANCIHFINKNNTWCMLAAIFKQIPHPARSDPDKHFDELRTGNTKEGHPGFTGYGSRHEGFTGSGRADHQDAFRNLATESLELARVLEKFDDLGHLELPEDPFLLRRPPRFGRGIGHDDLVDHLIRRRPVEPRMRRGFRWRHRKPGTGSEASGSVFPR